ncbi:helix-turn-helix domain-containing protein [Verticiella sediminum]|uniref:Helix-turn-helix domain-containing protein n=1 Tax=Verticiella sediminum TaxID=1247510 RepID=A0A556AJ56_9BURK|nr:IclR family transcriptional regulator C-terminal domain-containing protein [Verticiella sediminum]TSH92938.1 helix-turn-helix domain-containing protein [Verticiella sediminum]
MAEAPLTLALRVIDVLQSMNRRVSSTVHELHLDTGIPKPSIVRLLRTLQARDIVQHAPQYGTYMLGAQAVTLASGYHGAPRLVQAASGPLDKLTAAVRWPAAIADFEQDAMVVRYSTIPQSPLALLQSSVGMRLDVATRALGRAYLAHCLPDERECVLNLAGLTAQAIASRQALHRCLDDVRARGYALRDPVVRPVSSTIAVPVFEHGQVAAAIGLTWISSSLTPAQAAERYLRPLQHTAAAIGRNLHKLSSAGTATAQPRHERRPSTFRSPKSSDKAFAGSTARR